MDPNIADGGGRISNIAAVLQCSPHLTSCDPVESWRQFRILFTAHLLIDIYDRTASPRNAFNVVRLSELHDSSFSAYM